MSTEMQAGGRGLWATISGRGSERQGHGNKQQTVSSQTMFVAVSR